jgi:hypothetical protein
MPADTFTDTSRLSPAGWQFEMHRLTEHEQDFLKSIPAISVVFSRRFTAQRLFICNGTLPSEARKTRLVRRVALFPGKTKVDA